MVRETKLSPVGRVDSYPLSPMQQGMLFHRLQGCAPGVDVEQVICELHEPLDAARFEQAWRDVIERHTALRTGFHWAHGDEPRQVVYPAARVRMKIHHVEFGSEREARLGLEEYLAADRREGFGALTPPLLRVAVLRGGPAHFWFVVTYHHLVLDARSMTIMFQEALDLHDAFSRGCPIELPPARPYRSYIDWLQTLHQPRAESFWREQLADFTTPTVLPIARAADSADDDPAVAAGELAFRLHPAATTRLREIARKYEVTLNTLVQAAWAIVLSRYCGEDDVVFGALRACRKIPVEGAQSIVGLFINTVPVRVRVSPDAALGSWLRDLRHQWIALRDFEHTPLLKVQQWSGVAPGRPLFETILSFQEPSWDAALTALGGPWAGRAFDIRAQPNYPLALEVFGGPALTVKFIYNRSRFPDEAIARAMEHYRVVLEALATDAAPTIGALPMLTAREREQVLVAWNRTGRDYPRERCVQAYIEAHADASPERIAVTDSSITLTYGELNARAGRLARRLRALGIGPDALVAVCLDRSAEMIVAWLGALKAGGAFVPLDPAYPAGRLAFMLADSQAPVLVTRRAMLPKLPRHGAAVICLEGEMEPVVLDGLSGQVLPTNSMEPPDSAPDDSPAGSPSPDDLAYVIYTSGSTGQPKGVEIEHRALMNLVTWHQQVYEVTPADRATHLASPAFDASIWEIWPYLAAGASVHIPDDETRLSPALLWRWLADRKITLAFMPTPLAETAMSEPWPQDLTMRALLTGGDKLKRRPPKGFPCPVINHYGPTESTVVATCTTIDAHAGDAAAPTIGMPISNTQVYVLDRHQQPVPIGVGGELYIGGESLARGYLRHPELTAEKFLPNPFAASRPNPECHLLNDTLARQLQNGAGKCHLIDDTEKAGVAGAGGRLYRTGDLVRWTADGELEFLGRIDGQVKIRGCRIEPGEIEAAIHGHPSARESVVIARPDGRGQMQLVAYVLAPPGTGPHVETELTNFLRAKLPAYMVPAAIVRLEAWPLTPNGKIDRNALPAPFANSGDLRAPFAAPATPLEYTIAKIWSGVLGCSKVGLADNFFDLGGHSLLAAQVVSRLNAALEARVSVRALFDQPTLAAFVREVERHLDRPPASCVPLHRMKRRAARPELEVVQPR